VWSDVIMMEDNTFSIDQF